MSATKKAKIDVVIDLDRLRSQFHPTLNGSLRFDDLTRGSCKRVVWECHDTCCETPHIWTTFAYSRLGTQATGCPFCAPSGEKSCRCKSIGHRFPHIAAQIRDKTLDPFAIRATSNKNIFFKCPNTCCETEHVWSSIISNRVAGNGCPFCAGDRTCRCKSLGSRFPDVARELIRTSDDPFKICSHAGTYYWWRCSKKRCDCDNPHEWRTTVDSRTGRKRTGCPWCCSSRKRLCCETLATKHPDIASQLVDNTVDASTLSVGSGKTFLWRCTTKTCECDLDHVWSATVATRTSGRGCPWCAKNSHNCVCPCQSLGHRFPRIAAELIDPVDPFQISAQCGDRLTFRCTTKTCECDTIHEWTTLLTDRTSNGAGCPFCSGRRTCWCRSLLKLFPKVAAELADKSIDPTHISALSNMELEWRCLAGKGHANWTALVATRTRSGCPVCRTNKAETELDELLREHPRVAEHWKRAVPCYDEYTGKTRMLVPDACGRTISGKLFAIELDGRQHFESMSFNGGSQMTDLDDQMRRDVAKNTTLWQQGYSLLRISYKEFDGIREWVDPFLEDVSCSNCQIRRMSNTELYKDLEAKAVYGKSSSFEDLQHPV